MFQPTIAGSVKSEPFKRLNAVELLSPMYSVHSRCVLRMGELTYTRFSRTIAHSIRLQTITGARTIPIEKTTFI